jgi:carboxylesterase type B
MSWQGKEKDFERKLEKVVALIDTYCADGYTVSLLGTSAGGSAVVNAFAMRKDKIHRVINVCGRLRKGENVFPTLEKASLTSKSFYDSIIQCENNLKTLSPRECQQILTFRPLFDELVPSSTVSVPGAKNIILPTIAHILSISIAMTVFSKKIAEFVLKD